MAVVDRYVDTTDINSSGALIQPQATLNANGSVMRTAFVTFEVLAADSDTSVYRLFKALPASLVLLDVKIACDAITAGTSWDLGLYLTDLGAVISANVFMSAQTFASALDFGGPTTIDGMDNVAIENYGNALWQHAGHSQTTIPRTDKAAYDLCLTANTVGSADGTVSVIIEYALP